MVCFRDERRREMELKCWEFKFFPFSLLLSFAWFVVYYFCCMVLLMYRVDPSIKSVLAR
jgi:hypothetical protein